MPAGIGPVMGPLLRRLLRVLGLVLAGFVLLVLFLLYAGLFGPFGDTGSEYGYYGQYNRVKHPIQAMPNVKIVARLRHDDTVLERFGFTLLMDGTRLVQVNASIHRPEWRTWNKSRLRELIQKQIDANRPPEEYEIGLFPDSHYEQSRELKAWRQTRPTPEPPAPVDPTLPPNVRRTSRLKVPVQRPSDANQPTGGPAPGIGEGQTRK
jgi:hypothetical protein